MSALPTVVLSLRECFRGPAQGCVNELEDVFAALTGANVLAPRDATELATQLARLPAGGADLFFASISVTGPIALLKGIRDWRRPFRRVAGYVFDAWLLGDGLPANPLKRRFSRFAQAVAGIDHLFVSNEAAVPAFAAAYGVPVSHVAMAADVARFGNAQALRPISVNAYGRQHRPHTDVLAATFNTTASPRALYHTNHMAIGEVSDLAQHRAFFWKMLGLSAISLAYDAQRVDPDGRRFPFPFVGQRWYEAWTAGCAVVGWRPQCAEADALLSWPDATIEAPEAPADFLAFVEALLQDEARLARIRVRNVQEMARAHDWGHRVVAMLAALGDPAPPGWAAREQALAAVAAG